MKRFYIFLFLTSVLIVVLGHRLPPQITDMKEPIDLYQDEINLESSFPKACGGYGCDELMKDTTTLADPDKDMFIPTGSLLYDPDYELNSPVARSSIASEPVIEEKAYRPKFVPHHPVSHSSLSSIWTQTNSDQFRHNSQSSLGSSSVSISQSSSSKPSYRYTTGTGWLSVYKDEGSRLRAIAMKPRNCR